MEIISNKNTIDMLILSEQGCMVKNLMDVDDFSEGYRFIFPPNENKILNISIYDMKDKYRLVIKYSDFSQNIDVFLNNLEEAYRVLYAIVFQGMKIPVKEENKYQFSNKSAYKITEYQDGAVAIDIRYTVFLHLYLQIKNLINEIKTSTDLKTFYLFNYLITFKSVLPLEESVSAVYMNANSDIIKNLKTNMKYEDSLFLKDNGTYYILFTEKFYKQLNDKIREFNGTSSDITDCMLRIKVEENKINFIWLDRL